MKRISTFPTFHSTKRSGFEDIFVSGDEQNLGFSGSMGKYEELREPIDRVMIARAIGCFCFLLRIPTFRAICPEHQSLV